MAVKQNLENRIVDNVDIKPSPDGRYQDCWYWLKSKNKDGYGRFKLNRKDESAHRISAYLWLEFDLSSDLEVCHHCDNPSCVNPAHLFVGTDQDNKDDMCNKR